MQADTLRFDDIRYNPELEGFEAAVQIQDADQSYSYPVHLIAPLNADYALVARGLAQKAMAYHKGRGTGPKLRLRRLANTQTRAVAA